MGLEARFQARGRPAITIGQVQTAPAWLDPMRDTVLARSLVAGSSGGTHILPLDRDASDQNARLPALVACRCLSDPFSLGNYCLTCGSIVWGAAMVLVIRSVHAACSLCIRSSACATNAARPIAVALSLRRPNPSA